MINLRERLFTLFGKPEKLADQHKDAQGRGLKERFIRVLGAEYDESVLPLVENFLANVIDPETALAKFVPYLETQMGVNYQISDELVIRRKLIAWSSRITRIKGTKRSFEILLKLMGFLTVEIIEHFPQSGFDSPITLDDDERVFDGGCSGCVDYSLLLTGTLTMSDEVKAWIRSVVVYCEPINGRLREILYNGTPLVYGYIIAWINEEGDLRYDNTAAPRTFLQILDNGDLQIFGEGAGFYKVTTAGDLTYTAPLNK